MREDDATGGSALDVAAILRRQARAALPVAAAFVSFLAGLPLLNRFAPGTMATPIGPFPLNWLLLAVLVYPFTWGLARLFVRASERAEREIADLAARKGE